MQTSSIRYPLEIPNMDPNRLEYVNGSKSKWANLTCVCKYLNGRIRSTNVIVNCKNKKVYVNDSKLIIAKKLTGLSVITPWILIAKTIYHLLFPVSLAHQFYYVLKEAKNQAPVEKNLSLKIIKIIGKNFLDMLKTPLYAIAMTVVAISTLILSIFKREFLYEGREIFGKMLLSLNWGEKKNLWTYAPCMIPIANLTKDVREEKRFYSLGNIVYEDAPGTILHGLNNLANAHAY